MKTFLIIFDFYSHDWTSDGSDYVLKKSLVDAENEDDAIRKSIKKIIEYECYDDEDDVRKMVNKLIKEGISVIEVANKNVYTTKDFNYFNESKPVNQNKQEISKINDMFYKAARRRLEQLKETK